MPGDWMKMKCLIFEGKTYGRQLLGNQLLQEFESKFKMTAVATWYINVDWLFAAHNYPGARTTVA